MPELRCPRVTFFSSGDEASFFAWAERIPGVVEIAGRGDEIVIRVRSLRLSASSLREILALFHRYRVPMEQLRAFRTPGNASWFASPTAYWHRSVFSDGP